MIKSADCGSRRTIPRATLAVYGVTALLIGVVFGVVGSWLDGLLSAAVVVALGAGLGLRSAAGNETAGMLYNATGDERQRAIQRRAGDQTGRVACLASVIGWLATTLMHQHGAADAFEIMAVICGLTLMGSIVLLSRSA